MIKRMIKAAVCIGLLYVILGCILPLLYHKAADENLKENFSAGSCYGSQTGTERVLNIEDNFEALLWRIRVIETAREEIILSTFDFGNDESGEDIMACLLAAADRGVSVRMIIDGFNGMLKLSGSNRFKALISHPGVEAKFYNLPNPLLPWKMTLRLHDKYLIADDAVYILGGRNTNDLFLGNYRKKYNIDRDLLVYETDRTKEENSLLQVKKYFEEIWSLPDNKEQTSPGTDKKVKEAKEELRLRYAELKETCPQAFTNTDYEKHTIETNQITLLTSQTEPVNKKPNLWYMLHQLMLQGEQVVIQTPYIICGKDMYKDLEELCATTDTELIINAVENGANPWGCTDYLNQKKKIRKTGIKIYEFLGGQSGHTKTILVDDRLSIVGSFNLDMRSVYLDTEMMLAVDCRQLNGALRDDAERDKEMSRHVYPDGTYGMERRISQGSFLLGKKFIMGYCVL